LPTTPVEASSLNEFPAADLQQAPFVQLQWPTSSFHAAIYVLASARLMELHPLDSDTAAGSIPEVLTLSGDAAGSGVFRFQIFTDTRPGGLLLKFFGRANKRQLLLRWICVRMFSGADMTKTSVESPDPLACSTQVGEESFNVAKSDRQRATDKSAIEVKMAVAEAFEKMERSVGQALVAVNRRIDGLATHVAQLQTSVEELQREKSREISSTEHVTSKQ
jgi:hypothetical protein